MATWLWLSFFGLIGVLIALDLRVARRRGRDTSPSAAVGWTAAWIAVSLAVGGAIYLLYDVHWAGLGLIEPHGHGPPAPMRGHDAFLLFINAYVLEAALSLDNVFIITLLFDYLRVPRGRRHAVLFTGAYLAIPVRAALISVPLAVLHFAPWSSYIFGGFILLAAVRMLTLRTDDPDPDSNPAIRLVRKLYPVTQTHEGGRFFTRLPPEAGRVRGRLAATPLLLALVMVESADAFYSLGSIPAILAISEDPFLLISSNILAVLTVRSMYSALARVMHRFTYVKAALVFVLLFTAALMFLAQHYAIAPEVALSVIVGILCVGAGASLVADRGGAGARVPEPPLGYEVAHFAGITVRQAKKLIILVMGLSIVALSVPIGMLLPGPGGIPMAILGLMILATEFVWVRRLLRRARQSADFATAEAEKRFGLVTKFRRLKAWVGRRLGWEPPPAA